MMNPRLSLLLSCGTAIALAGCADENRVFAESQNLYTVVREDLPLTVKENAELQAITVTRVRCEVEGNATLLDLIEEGSSVKKGDKLFEVDVTGLVEKRSSQEISVEKARSAWEQARTQKAILEKELTTKRNTASSQLTISQMELEKLLGAATEVGATGRNRDMVLRLKDLIEAPQKASAPRAAVAETTQTGALITRLNPRNYAHLLDKVVTLLEVTNPDAPESLKGDPLGREMGELANRVLQQADNIRLAMADLKIKEETLAHSRRLYEKQFITRNELERDELSFQSQESKVTIAWKDLELLISYELPTQRIQREQTLANATLELERVTAQNDAERKKSEFDVDGKEREYLLAKERLENLVRQIDSSICYAPTPGIVVYARLNRDRRSSESVSEGVTVRERQVIIELPDNTRMRCDVKIQEAQVDRVAIGQPAHISVEAFPNEIFTGHVVRVSPTADSNSSWGGSDKKVYTTIVDLDGENEDGRLRTRMAAGVTITTGLIEAAVTVPQQSVRRDRSVNYVWKKTADGAEAVPVRIGAYNQEKVEIVEGVMEGDVIFRTPPRDQAEPRFDQPELPAGATIPKRIPKEPTSKENDAKGDAQPGETGEREGRAGRGGRGATKPFAEMTPEELDDYKENRLSRVEGMADRIQDEAAATKYRAATSALRAALDSDDLAGAQQHADSLRQIMMDAFSGMRRNREGGGTGGGRDGGGRNNGSGGREGGGSGGREGGRRGGGGR